MPLTFSHRIVSSLFYNTILFDEAPTMLRLLCSCKYGIIWITLFCRIRIFVIFPIYNSTISREFTLCKHTFMHVCTEMTVHRPRRRRLEAFTTDSKIIRLISRRVAIFPAAAAARQIFDGDCDAANREKKFPWWYRRISDPVGFSINGQKSSP